MITLKMPSFGSDMDIGKVVEWVVKPGESFAKGQTLALIDTAKGLIDMEAFENGIVESYLIELDQEVPVGTPIFALVEEAICNKAVTPGIAAEVKIQKKPANKTTATHEKTAIVNLGNLRVSPAARVYAQKHNIDLGNIQGSGPLQSIVLKDLNKESGQSILSSAVKSVAKSALKPTVKDQKRFDTALMRKAISGIVSQSKKEIPHYYLSLTINIEKLQSWLMIQNEHKDVEERLLIQAPILCAIKNALKKNPLFNGFYLNDEFEARQQINLGIAISLRGGGLVTPAILDTEDLVHGQLMNRLKSISERAKHGGLKQSEVTGATITISNIGDRGVDVIFGVIFPPQVALIGIGKVINQPVCVKNKVVVNPVMTITLAADHRVTDGHDGAKLLNEIDKQLQKPEAL